MTGTKPRFCSEGNRGVCGYHQDQDHPGWVFVITIIYLSFTEACWKCYCALSAARASIQVGSEWMPYFRLPAAAVGQLLRAKGAPDSGCLGVKIIQPWGYIPTLDNVCGNQKHPIDGPPNQQGLVETSFWSQLVWPIPWFRDEDSTLWLSSTKPRVTNRHCHHPLIPCCPPTHSAVRCLWVVLAATATQILRHLQRLGRSRGAVVLCVSTRLFV